MRRYTGLVKGNPSEIIQRMRTTLDLFELGEKMLRQRLRRERPEDSDNEIEEAVHAWRTKKHNADLGDAPGRLRRWPSS